MNLVEILNQVPQYWLLALIVFIVFIVFFIWNIILGIKLNQVKKRLNRMLRGSQITNLEQVIEEYTSEIQQIKQQVNTNSKNIEFIMDKLSTYKGKVGVVRYNAFGEEGNDLSYSIAIIDEGKNGVVISSIYNRGQSNTYAKPIKAGDSVYKLSKEEIEAISKAIEH